MKFNSFILLLSVSIFGLIFIPKESKAQFHSNTTEESKVEENSESNTNFHFNAEKVKNKEDKKKSELKSEKIEKKSKVSESRQGHASSSGSSNLINAFYVLVSHLLRVPDTSLHYF